MHGEFVGVVKILEVLSKFNKVILLLCCTLTGMHGIAVF